MYSMLDEECGVPVKCCHNVRGEVLRQLSKLTREAGAGRQTIPLCFNHFANTLVSGISTMGDYLADHPLFPDELNVSRQPVGFFSGVRVASSHSFLLTCASLKKSPNCREAPASAGHDVTESGYLLASRMGNMSGFSQITPYPNYQSTSAK